jgi:DNA-binding CsgD family transcriptional regulator
MMSMPSNISSLTEKEKEALRLLVTGYDAKSMARHLGLSIHTINERLREARRKLSVGSSREAARLLRTEENAHPQNLGSEFLGDAQQDQSADVSETPAQQMHWGWWIGGITMMSIAIVAAVALLSPADKPPAQSAKSGNTVTISGDTITISETGPGAAAWAWLMMVDRKDWRGSWEATTRSFQSLNSQERWAKVAASVQGPLGQVISHDLVSNEFVPAPPAGYQMVKFRSNYTNKANVLITITLEQEGDLWKVAGIVLD